jgi:parallel beta-helix repeat protein
MFSTSGTIAALAILALSVSVIDTDPVPPNAVTATYLVAADGTGGFTSIQAAVDAASDGDTIKLEPGEYRESVTVDKDITIVGDSEDASQVVILIPPDGPQVRLGAHRMNFAFELQDAEASIGGLSIHGSGLRTTAFVLRGGEPTIHDVDIDLGPLQALPRAFIVTDGQVRGSVRDSTSNAPALIGNGSIMTLYGNATTGSDLTNGFAVWADGAHTDVELLGNHVNGISIGGGAHGSVRDNEVMGADGCGIEATGRGTSVVAIGNVVRSSWTGICTSGQAAATIEGNSIYDSGTGISLGSDDALVSSNDVRANDVGVLVRVGAPTIIDNTITENRAGLALGNLPAAPALSGNELCANEMNVEVPDSIEPPSLDGNEVC